MLSLYLQCDTIDEIAESVGCTRDYVHDVCCRIAKYEISNIPGQFAEDMEGKTAEQQKRLGNGCIVQPLVFTWAKPRTRKEPRPIEDWTFCPVFNLSYMTRTYGNEKWRLSNSVTVGDERRSLFAEARMLT